MTHLIKRHLWRIYVWWTFRRQLIQQEYNAYLFTAGQAAPRRTLPPDEWLHRRLHPNMYDYERRCLECGYYPTLNLGLCPECGTRRHVAFNEPWYPLDAANVPQESE